MTRSASALSTLAFEGPADELTRTHNAQPALLAHSAAVWAVVREAIGPMVRAAAGHSLGEFTAYHVAGMLDLPEAARVVRRRGTLMYEQGIARPGAMAAVLGALSRPIVEICAEASAAGALVVPANFNSPEQVVISGEVAGVERAMALCKDAGAKRCLPLPVSGAFHSPLMEPAAAGLLAGAGHGHPARRRASPVFANVNGEPVTDSAARLRAARAAAYRAGALDHGHRASRARAIPMRCSSRWAPVRVLAGLTRRIAPQLPHGDVRNGGGDRAVARDGGGACLSRRA